MIALCIQKIDDVRGRPPCPRFSHAATSFKNMTGEFCLVISGGRNDEVYSRIHNVALNDLCIYNANRREWQALAMYGTIPTSRWSHTICMNGENRGDGFIVLGGVNLDSYLKPKMHLFSILNSFIAGGEDDEKLDILKQSVSEKVDIIKQTV